MNQTQTTVATVRLIPEFEGPSAKSILVTGERFLIGRDDSCHLRPSSKLVSRWHAEIRADEQGAVLRDLGSSNGTFLNGMPVGSQMRIHDGDTIKLGPLDFRVSIERDEDSDADEQPDKESAEPQFLPSDAELASWLIPHDDLRPSDATQKSR